MVAFRIQLQNPEPDNFNMGKNLPPKNCDPSNAWASLPKGGENSSLLLNY